MKTILALLLSSTLAAMAGGITMTARPAGAWTKADDETWEREFGEVPKYQREVLQAVEVTVRSSAADDATAYIEVNWLRDGEKPKDGARPPLVVQGVIEVRVQPGQERRIKVPSVKTTAGKKYKLAAPFSSSGQGAKLVWVLRMFDPATGKQLAAAASRPPLVALMDGVALPVRKETP